MDVHAPEARTVEDVAPQDAPISDDERDVGRLGARPRAELPGAQLRRLDDGQPQRPRAHLDRGRRQREPATGRLVGLTDDRDHVRDRGERVERRHRKGRGAEEERAQPIGHASLTLPTSSRAVDTAPLSRPILRLPPRGEGSGMGHAWGEEKDETKGQGIGATVTWTRGWLTS